MMDTDIFVPAAFQNGTTGENGVRKQISIERDENTDVEEANGIVSGTLEMEECIENFEAILQMNGNSIGQEANSLTASKEHEVNDAKNSVICKNIVTSKNGKNLDPKKASGTRIKSTKESSVSQSTSTRLKHSEKCNGHSVEDASETQGLTEKMKPNKGKKVVPNKAEGIGDAKPQRKGMMPSYSFSFKCNERAEKRREYFSKLEEKIHAKEMEKSDLQAKTKEDQEAEIKMLRKSLTFKATPMPSFYQEPPSKPELKKKPATRAKSPKFARKDLHIGDVEENSGHSVRSSRLSVDEKLLHKNPAKGPPAIHSKKLIRKSLPKLPSQKTNMTSNKIAAASQKIIPVDETNTLASEETLESAPQNKAEPDAAPSLNQPIMNIAPQVEDNRLVQVSDENLCS